MKLHNWAALVDFLRSAPSAKFPLRREKPCDEAKACTQSYQGLQSSSTPKSQRNILLLKALYAAYNTKPAVIAPAGFRISTPPKQKPATRAGLGSQFVELLLGGIPPD